jgi:4'-phosphopantetheinyl transferase EntD
MIEQLVPAGAVAVEAFGDDPGEEVFAGEEGAIGNAVPSRRREFVTARRCAREALESLGCRPAPIHRGRGREPLWPAGVVGSITHCDGYRAAVVAPVDVLAGIGVDVEPNAALDESLVPSIASAAEVRHLAGLYRDGPSVAWDRLLWSAKESVYKVWYPLTGRWLDFLDADLTFDPPTRTFAARLLVPGDRLAGGTPLTVLTGRYSFSDELILAAAFLRP